MPKQSYCIYILNCNNGSYYTGYTTDIDRRFNEHIEGTIKCKYTRSFKPLDIAQYWQVEDKKLAMEIERYIKNMSKNQKQQLLINPQQLEQIFACKAMLINNKN